MIEGALATTASKGVLILVNLVSIPIVVRYLGPERFGIWVTITTALSMLLVLDLGIANSLTNFISEAYAQESRANAGTYATTALVIMTAVSLMLAGIGWAGWPLMHWDAVFHLASPAEGFTVGHAVAVAVGIFLVGLPASLAPKILGGYQELRAANIFASVGSVCNLLSIIALVSLHAGLVALVAASAASYVGANLLCLLWIWIFHKPWLAPRAAHLRLAAGRRMVQTGGEFFILQIAGLVVFNSDNLVVTHYLGPAEVAPYSLAWRLVGYAAIAQTMLSPALWPAFSEAFARGDIAWVRKTFRRTMGLTMGIAFAFSIVCAVWGRWVIRVWASKAVVPSERLMLLMCLWVLISTFMNNTSTVLVAKGETRMQAWLSLLAAAVNLWLSIYWVQRIGSVGVILATIVSYLLVLVAPQTWKTFRVLSSREPYVGAKQHGKGARGRALKSKEVVIGIKQRGGELRFFHASDVKSGTLAEYIKENVCEDIDVVMTDDFGDYPPALAKAGVLCEHKTINHSSGVYVDGDTTANGIESAFSLLKREMVGSWHKISAKHLSAYLDEMTFRLNSRDNPCLFRDTMKS